MNCCESFNDLECVGSCTATVRLGDNQLGERDLADFKVNVMFPDVCHCITPTVDDEDYLVIATDKLNEDYTHKLALYHQSTLEECFKIKVTPEICN